MKNKIPQIAYRYWQNRATPFYLAARILIKNRYTPEAAAFCGFQAVESIIKAALDYHSISFTRIHSLAKLIKLLPKSIKLNVPKYLDDFQAVPRYPESGKNNSRGSGLVIPSTFIDDLDRIMYDVISQVLDKKDTRLSDYFIKNRNIPELSKNNKYFLQFKSFYQKSK